MYTVHTIIKLPSNKPLSAALSKPTFKPGYVMPAAGAQVSDILPAAKLKLASLVMVPRVHLPNPSALNVGLEAQRWVFVSVPAGCTKGHSYIPLPAGNVNGLACWQSDSKQVSLLTVTVGRQKFDKRAGH